MELRCLDQLWFKCAIWIIGSLFRSFSLPQSFRGLDLYRYFSLFHCRCHCCACQCLFQSITAVGFCSCSCSRLFCLFCLFCLFSFFFFFFFFFFCNYFRWFGFFVQPQQAQQQKKKQKEKEKDKTKKKFTHFFQIQTQINKHKHLGFLFSFSSTKQNERKQDQESCWDERNFSQSWTTEVCWVRTASCRILSISLYRCTLIACRYAFLSFPLEDFFFFFGYFRQGFWLQKERTW